MGKAMISWYTPPVGVGVGYGYAAVSLIKALNSHKVSVMYDNIDAKVYISFVQPEYYRGLKDQYRIGYTPWESTALPASWPGMMAEMDEIWTTSKFCKDVYDAYDIKSKIIPHGVDPEIYSIVDRSISDKFVFLHIGGPTERKGAQRVVDAFLKVFDNKKYDDVFLILKSNGPSEARWYKGDTYMGNIATHPKVHVITSYLDESDLADLCHRAHCMVYPTNGEGFGLIPFQAIATGMPTICTNATGCADFAELSIPLDYTWIAGEGIHIGDWVEPDFDDLCEKMLFAYENWESAKKLAMQSAHIIHAEQKWEDIAAQVIHILGDKIYQVI